MDYRVNKFVNEPRQKAVRPVLVPHCSGSTVQPVETGLYVLGVAHAGVLSHCCGLDLGHPGACVCDCKFLWYQFSAAEAQA